MRHVEIVKNQVIVPGLVFNILEFFILSSCGLRLSAIGGQKPRRSKKKSKFITRPKDSAMQHIQGSPAFCWCIFDVFSCQTLRFRGAEKDL